MKLLKCIWATPNFTNPKSLQWGAQLWKHSECLPAGSPSQQEAAKGTMLDRQISLPQIFKLLSSDIDLYELVNWGSEIQGISRSFVSFHEFKRVVDKTMTRPDVENSTGRAKPCPALGGYPGNAVYKLCLWSIWIVIASYRFQHSLVAHSLRVPVCLNTLTALMKQTGLNISLSLNCINSHAYLLQSPLKLCSDPFLCLQLALLPATQAPDIHLHIWH